MREYAASWEALQATDPEELEIAVRVVLTVPSDAVVTLVAIRLLPDNSRRPMFDSEALQSIAPLELIALIVVVDVRVPVSIVELVTKIVPFDATMAPASSP